ncbi:drug/metabolite transporter (DMT)-like permease [Pelomonas saccharophila]|uniref:Drug/metabolite transporter (DMT)-like permease n=1 Tax=Roseateles saccharophilus TaxID=304 RepID=A0ABU1YLI1_ROSSA|nr:DMT family transporter [Roseateles saccharophilus]MDR7269718.1 drug/metabolite transporter (DMT)-like permease [Roseateles saccharophilus]
MTRHTHLDPRAIAILLLCCLLWGINQVAAKAALTEIGPLWQAGLRSVVAGFLVWLWSMSRGIKLFERDGSLWGGVLAGLLFAAEFGCIFVGLQYTSASRMVVFIYLAPFVVALGMPWIARGEALSARQWVGLVLAFGAMAFAFAEGFSAPGTPLQWWGDALGVAAAVLWGGTTLAIRATKLSSAPAEKTLLYQLGVSAVALCAAAVFAGEPLPLHWSPRLFGLFGFQAVVVTFASYLAWFWLIRHYAATKLAVFTLSTPLFGLVAGALLLGEGISARLIAALAALAVGIVLVNQR